MKKISTLFMAMILLVFFTVTAGADVIYSGPASGPSGMASKTPNTSDCKALLKNGDASSVYFGRLSSPETGMDVALYYAEDYSVFQSIVDANDSACFFDWLNGNMIAADHSHQGFRPLKTNVQVGSLTYVITTQGTEQYVCIDKISDGTNTGEGLNYSGGTPLEEVYREKLITYTCNSDGTGYITIAIWEKASADSQRK